jgi:hypothetical protein
MDDTRHTNPKPRSTHGHVWHMRSTRVVLTPARGSKIFDCPWSNLIGVNSDNILIGINISQVTSVDKVRHQD